MRMRHMCGFVAASAALALAGCSGTGHTRGDNGPPALPRLAAAGQRSR